ncbi:hypothetical protein [Hafnia paralvei]|nr:hypothetical protein [Hafnia paralvei]
MTDAVQQGWCRAGTTLIELQVSPSEGAETLRDLLAQVAAL